MTLAFASVFHDVTPGAGGETRTHVGFPTAYKTVAIAAMRLQHKVGSPAWARSTDLLLNRQTLLPTELLGN